MAVVLFHRGKELEVLNTPALMTKRTRVRK